MATASLYKNVYGDSSNPYYSDSYGIRVKQGDQEFWTAILCGGRIAFSITDSSFAVQDNLLFLCYGNEVYALTLPHLQLLWHKQLDFAASFGIYPFQNDFIIHGEVDITKINAEGIIKWQFSARDIFVNLNGKKEFEIVGDTIRLTDFDDCEYILDENGKIIRDSGRI